MRRFLQEGIAEKIRSRTASVAVIGMGHVGLPLAVTFAQACYPTIGVDKSVARLASLKHAGYRSGDDWFESVLTSLITEGKLELATDTREATRRADCILICVPTPAGRHGRPDTSVICETLRSISKSLSPGKLVVIESTVYPGFTDTVARSILEKSGMKCGVDFGLAHSPSRVDPGNTRHRLVEIPKVLGGVEQDSGEVAALLYESIIKAGVIRVTDTRTAECVKMLENVYRFVNIALVNEFALFCERVGVNVFDAIKAAASKPFGFHPHYPGPGVGGPCIPKDQLYLRYSAHKVRLRLRVVEASAKTNDMMTDEVAEEVQAQMKRFRVTSPKIAVLGLAYKKDRPETVESPAVKVISRLLSKKRGHARLGLALYDPCVSSVVVNGKTLECEKTLEQAAARADCLLFLVDHEAFSDLELPNLKRIVARECVVVDTKNIFEAREVEEVGFRYVGLGKPHRCPNAQSTKRP